MTVGRSLVVVGTLAMTGGCSLDVPTNVCSQEFRAVSITAVDSTGAPVTMASVASTLVRTGQPLHINTLIDPIPGVYVILDDGAVGQINASGDSVRVTLARGDWRTSATYFFDVVDVCHINKVSGPDTLVVQ